MLSRPVIKGLRIDYILFWKDLVRIGDAKRNCWTSEVSLGHGFRKLLKSFYGPLILIYPLQPT